MSVICSAVPHVPQAGRGCCLVLMSQTRVRSYGAYSAAEGEGYLFLTVPCTRRSGHLPRAHRQGLHRVARPRRHRAPVSRLPAGMPAVVAAAVAERLQDPSAAIVPPVSHTLARALACCCCCCLSARRPLNDMSAHRGLLRRRDRLGQLHGAPHAPIEDVAADGARVTLRESSLVYIADLMDFSSAARQQQL